MAFLAAPLILVVFIAFCVRLKNLGKLNNLAAVSQIGKNLESKQNKIGKWIGEATNRKKRNAGFTRLNQDSDNEEAEQLNKASVSNSDSESDEIGIQLPTLSKA